MDQGCHHTPDSPRQSAHGEGLVRPPRLLREVTGLALPSMKDVALHLIQVQFYTHGKIRKSSSWGMDINWSSAGASDESKGETYYLERNFNNSRFVACSREEGTHVRRAQRSFQNTTNERKRGLVTEGSGYGKERLSLQPEICRHQTQESNTATFQMLGRTQGTIL